jgi:hypothetical protein
LIEQESAIKPKSHPMKLPPACGAPAGVSDRGCRPTRDVSVDSYSRLKSGYRFNLQREPPAALSVALPVSVNLF